ncbi:hypothetical protein [uncultured Draconibacterium sp.]|uniref:hypothetical protein n=1 Tax=uncultured Draconibacterium sp. TaxID=1573823 RepID=UPI002AA9195B|nr:hypothetical protein [uncultured Draconibacterium sp.]
MVRLKKHIIHLTLAILLAVLAVANAAAQTPITVHECDTMTFSVSSRPSIDDTHFIWDVFQASNQPVELLDETLALDRATSFVDGQYAGRTVQVIGLAPGEYYVSIHVWDEISCTDNIEMYVLTVLESELEMEISADSVCIGEPTNVYIRFSGRGPYEVQYTIGDQVTPSVVNVMGGVDDPELVIPVTDPLPVGETTFWIIRVEDNCKAYEYDVNDRPGTGIVIYPKPSQSQIYLKDD